MLPTLERPPSGPAKTNSNQSTAGAVVVDNARNTIVCSCGQCTYAATSSAATAKIKGTCWFAINADGNDCPGCVADERFAELAARRADLKTPRPLRRLRAALPAGQRVHCRCGRETFVATAELSADPPLDPDPLDERYPILTNSCWLAIAGEERIAWKRRPDFEPVAAPNN